MYSLIRASLPRTLKPSTGTWRQLRRGRVSGNVLCFGLTSLFTDISSEMVSAILPLYLVFHLGFSVFEFGLIDGLYQAVAALLSVAGALAADRWSRHKEVAAAGYTLSATCKLGLLAVGGSLPVLGGIILLDRTGKGIRTAPRDALISLSSRRSELATAFGVHRALDTAGALIGPFLAFGLLAWVPNRFDTVFVVSFCAAAVGLSVLLLFVENRGQRQLGVAKHTVSLNAALRLVRASRFRNLLVAGAVLSTVTISDAFIYLGLQHRLSFNAAFLPLLYLGTAAFYLAFAVPAGWLADRIGRGRMFIGGYFLLLLVYLSLLLPASGAVVLLAALVLLGAFYAATDGVLMALVSAVVPPGLRTSGIALLTMVTSGSRLLAAALFGGLWTRWSADTAAATFVVGLLAAGILASRMVTGAANAVPCGATGQVYEP